MGKGGNFGVRIARLRRTDALLRSFGASDFHSADSLLFSDCEFTLLFNAKSFFLNGEETACLFVLIGVTRESKMLDLRV